MKKPAIVIGGGLAVVVAIVAIAVIVLWSNLDSIVKAAIEKVGGDATQASVSVDKVGLDIPGGAAAISGLTVGNPSGFKAPNAFMLGNISVKLDTGSVTGDTILIHEIIVDAPQLTYELTEEGNNIGALRKNVEDYAKQFSDPNAAPAADSGPGKKLIIERLVLQNGSVAIRAPLADIELSQPLPRVVLTDIGKKSGGAHAGEVAQQVFAAVSTAVGSAVSNSALTTMLSEQGGAVLNALKGGLGDGLGQGGAAMESLGKQLEGLSGSAGGATDDAKKAVEGVGDKLKGILGH
jgi:hypothetical protein